MPLASEPDATTRRFAPLALCLGLLLLVAGSAEEPSPAAGPAPAAPASSPPPNLLLVIADDQAWTDFGFMGHPEIRTPNLDRLASEGLRYTRGYAPHSVCRPSLATLATGLYPHEHGIATNWPPGHDSRVGFAKRTLEENPDVARQAAAYSAQFDAAPKLAGILAANGYRTFQAGKWWEGDYRRGGFEAGTDDPELAYRIGRSTLEPVTRFMTEARDDGAPFFLWYAPLLPHGPHDPPPRLADHYRDLAPGPVARYWAMCERLDETVGELLGFLETQGLAENTLVVFVSDNGWITHGNNPNPVRSKLTPYDGGVRTPIVLRWPGHAAVRENGLDSVSLVDIAPTLLAAAGIKPPETMPGVDLLDAAAVRARKRIFGATFTKIARALSDPGQSLRYRYTVQGPWKLILPNPAVQPGEPSELYNLRTDPEERVNLADVQARRVDQMTRQLDLWWNPN